MKKITVGKAFNLVGKNILGIDKGRWRHWGKIEGIYTLGNNKFAYMIYNKDNPHGYKHYKESVKNVHTWLSQRLLKIKK